MFQNHSSVENLPLTSILSSTWAWTLKLWGPAVPEEGQDISHGWSQPISELNCPRRALFFLNYRWNENSINLQPTGTPLQWSEMKMSWAMWIKALAARVTPNPPGHLSICPKRRNTIPPKQTLAATPAHWALGSLWKKHSDCCVLHIASWHQDQMSRTWPSSSHKGQEF